MAGTSTGEESVVHLGREAVETARRLVLLEIELIKAQAKATALRLAAGLGLILLSLVCVLFFIVFLIGTVDEGTSFNDNALMLIFVAGVPVTALIAWSAARGPRILNTLLWLLTAAAGAATVTALIAFMIVAIAFPGTGELRRGWAISALSFFVILAASGGTGVWLILRAITGGKETAADVKSDVSWAVDDVKSRRWRD